MKKIFFHLSYWNVVYKFINVWLWKILRIHFLVKYRKFLIKLLILNILLFHFFVFELSFYKNDISATNWIILKRVKFSMLSFLENWSLCAGIQINIQMLCYIWIYHFVLKDHLNLWRYELSIAVYKYIKSGSQTQTQKLIHKNICSILFY